MESFTFCLASEIDGGALAKRLPADFCLAEPEEFQHCEDVVLLDTFTSELFLKMRVLLQSAKELLLYDLQTGALVCECLAAGAGDWKFADELGGEVGIELCLVSRLRSFQPVASLQLRRCHTALLDDERKTRVRLSLLTLSNGDNTVTLGTLEGLRGYEDDAEFLQAALLGNGATPCSGRLLYKGLGLALPAYAAKPEIELIARDGAKESARKIITAHIEVARKNEPGIIGDLDTEFLHDYRVSLRKVRSVLSLFKGVYSAKDTERLKVAVADVMKSTNRLRDLDVFLLNRTMYLATVPEYAREGLEQLFVQVADERHQALLEVVATLKSKSYKQQIERIAAQFTSRTKLANGPHAKEDSLEMGCRLILRRFNKICKIAATIDHDTPDEKVHELRINCKKLRYLMEFFTPLFSEESIKPLIKALKKLQDRLGDFNDYSVQQEFIRELLPDGRGRRAADLVVAGSIGTLGGILYMKQRAEKDKIMNALAGFISSKNRQAFVNLFFLEDT